GGAAPRRERAPPARGATASTYSPRSVAGCWVGEVYPYRFRGSGPPPPPPLFSDRFVFAGICRVRTCLGFGRVAVIASVRCESRHFMKASSGLNRPECPKTARAEGRTRGRAVRAYGGRTCASGLWMGVYQQYDR